MSTPATPVPAGALRVLRRGSRPHPPAPEAPPAHRFATQLAGLLQRQLAALDAADTLTRTDTAVLRELMAAYKPLAALHDRAHHAHYLHRWLDWLQRTHPAEYARAEELVVAFLDAFADVPGTPDGADADTEPAAADSDTDADGAPPAEMEARP